MPIEHLDYYEESYDEWTSIAGVKLGELVDYGYFDWSADYLDWREFAHDDEMYTRICDAFIERYTYRELSMYPFRKWAMKLHYKICYELCPKYNRLYDLLDGVNILADYDRYGKKRAIKSDYPETLLGGNADYTSAGNDEEYEDIQIGNAYGKIIDVRDNWRELDALFLDELEPFFAGFSSTVFNVE